jgi:hypothetical protein
LVNSGTEDKDECHIESGFLDTREGLYGAFYSVKRHPYIRPLSPSWRATAA